MATQSMTLQQEQLDIIRTISSLEDLEMVKKIRKYINRILVPKPDPLYSPENIAAVKQAYEEYKQGKSVRMTDEMKQYYFGDL